MIGKEGRVVRKRKEKEIKKRFKRWRFGVRDGKTDGRGRGGEGMVVSR